MEKNNKNRDFNSLITEWFDNTNKYFNDVFDEFKNTEKYTKLLDTYNRLSTQISKDNAKKHISGMFDKLSEEEQQKVVDNFNAVNEQFSKWFGTENKKYTVEDFKGWNVDVQVPEEKKDEKKEFEKLKDVVNENEKCSTENCKCEKCSCDSQNKSVVDSLFDELSETTTSEEYAADVAAKVVAVLSDKKNKNYKLFPKSKNEHPYVVVELDLDETFEKIENRTIELICESIETTLGLKENSVIIDPVAEDAKRVKITIILNKK